MKKRMKGWHEGETENIDRWLVSYADFITLLFAFFVTMYAISKVDQQKLIAVTHSLQRALGSPERSNAIAFEEPIHANPSLVPSVKTANVGRDNFSNLIDELQREIKKVFGSAGQIRYLVNETGLVIRVPERLFFDSGDASIHPEVFPILNAMIKVLEREPNSIRVEGHTDNVPINNSRFPSNWELSTARATAIIRYFLSHGNFDADRISAAGYAEFRPVAPNTTPEGRLQNRRVDVVILASKGVEAKSWPGEP